MPQAVGGVGALDAARRCGSIFVRLSMVIGLAAPLAAAAAEKADAIFVNGDVYTMNPAQPTAEAFAVRSGRIAAVGTNRDIRRWASAATKRVDLRGAFVMPGLLDGHVHPVTGGLKALYECSFPFTAGPPEIESTLRACAARIPAGTWIRGGQWDSGFFETYRIDSPREFLDRITDRHPVILVDDSLHNGWANSAALRAMGIDEKTPDPEGGKFVRDASGRPNGLMIENAYRQQVRPRLPAWSSDQIQAAASEANRIANAYGITAVKDANALPEYVEAYHALDARNALTMHVATALNTPTGARVDPLDYAALERTRDRFRSAHVHTAFVKLFLDGVPTPARSAAMIAPYVADPKFAPGYSGDVNFGIGTLARDVVELDRRGFTVKIHTAGDRSVRAALDAIEVARRMNGNTGLRHELAHAGFIDPTDLPRFAQLDVVADFSPILWHPSPIVRSIISAVGDRGRSYWPTRSLLDSGATLLAGSDWPAAVPDQNPWVGIEAMVTRTDPRGTDKESLWPAEAIGLEAALRIYTLGTARALRLDDRIGSLEVGKSADFIVLDRSPFKMPIEEVGGTQVRETYFEGRRVFRRAK